MIAALLVAGAAALACLNLLVELGASLFARGYSVGSAGNISVRLPDGYLGAVSVRRTEYETTRVDRLALSAERYWNAWRAG